MRSRAYDPVPPREGIAVAVLFFALLAAGVAASWLIFAGFAAAWGFD